HRLHLSCMCVHDNAPLSPPTPPLSPTRLSSDRRPLDEAHALEEVGPFDGGDQPHARDHVAHRHVSGNLFALLAADLRRRMGRLRSEEHTSELQSLPNLLFRTLPSTQHRNITSIP